MDRVQWRNGGPALPTACIKIISLTFPGLSVAMKFKVKTNERTFVCCTERCI